jgi:hypothetical protein
MSEKNREKDVEPRERRTREEAVANKLSPAMPPAGAALFNEFDPRLDQESETEKEIEMAADNDNDETESGRESTDTSDKP